MKFSLLLLLALALAQDYEYDGDVLILTEKNFDAAVAEFEYLFLEFYAPWCGHCKSLAPEYALAATALRPEGVALAKIDATVEKSLAEKYGVKGYPTLKFLVKGTTKDFDGARTADGIKNYVYSNLNPESDQLESIEQVEQAIKANSVQIVYFGTESSEKDRELRKYKEFSFTMKSHFAHTIQNSIRQHFNVPKGVAVQGFRNGKAFNYQGKIKFPELRLFVENLSFERIVDFNDRKETILERLFTKPKPVVIVFTNSEEAQEAAAQYVQEDLIFVQNVDEDTLRRLQIRPQDAAGVFGIKGEQKFKKLTNQSVSDFLSQFKDLKATKYLKSQEVTQDSGPVQTLVGQNYDTVFSGSPIVVLYYDSSNAEHLAVLEHYTKIAEKHSSLSKFSKIDISQNEVPDLNEASNEIVKIRIYKGKQFTKFIIKSNKIQEERFGKWLTEQTQGKQDL